MYFYCLQSKPTNTRDHNSLFLTCLGDCIASTPDLGVTIDAFSLRPKESPDYANMSTDLDITSNIVAFNNFQTETMKRQNASSLFS